MEAFLNNKKLVTIVGLGVVVVALILIFVMGGNGGVANMAQNSKLDQSKKVKSNVGDSTVGGDNLQLEGISVGGNFNLDKHQANKTTTTTTSSKSEDTTEEVYDYSEEKK